MPNYPNIKNQILQAKKLWRKLASSFHSKLTKFKRSKSLKRLKITLGSKRSSRSIHTRKMHRHVYVDELYKQTVAPPIHIELVKNAFYEEKNLEKSSKKSEMKRSKKGDYSSSSNFNIGSLGPSSRGATWEVGEVDLRAERFIEKFKEEMRLQRQRSFEEYRDMLARSV